MEGEDGDSSDLEVTKVARKEPDLSNYVNEITRKQSEILNYESDTVDQEVDNDFTARSPLSRPQTGNVRHKEKRVIWSEDEEREEDDTSRSHPDPRNANENTQEVYWSEDEDREAVYNKFKNRRSIQRKLAAAEIRKTKIEASIRAAARSSIVGRKAKRRKLDPGTHEERRRKESNVFGDQFSSEDGSATREDLSDEVEEKPVDESIPDYIKNRQMEFKREQEKFGAAGFRIPPSYEDVHFSEDDSPEHVPLEKPNMKHITPQKPYRGIRMSRSKGLIPAPIAQWLRDYQVQGVEFLHGKFFYQTGGILGDDMGLGKTIQVIAFLTVAFGKTGDERDKKRMRKIRRMHDDRWYPKVLIICPGSLMQNWQDELEKWGWWQVYVYHGPPSDREAALKAAESGRLEIMITTYSTYRINNSAINTIDWDCVIADECHMIKSRKSSITQAMNEINALCRIGLTGTAIQNNYEELWTLLNWSNPGQVGSLSKWKSEFSNHLKIGQAHDATNEQLAKARNIAEMLVKEVLPKFFLRRVKSLIADQLPKKSDRVVFCPPTDAQAEAYQNFVDGAIVEYIRRSSDPCECNSGKKRGYCCFKEIPGHDKWQNHVFPCMLILQKIANHLALLLPTSCDAPVKQEKDLEALKAALPDQWKDLCRNKGSILNHSNRRFCGKWKVLRRLLDFWHQEGDKVLVFSHSVRLLKMLKTLFDVDGTTYNFSYLDGSMSYDDRAKTVADFNADPNQFVFLISTKAGGVGLNITSANKVVVVDPHWNPAYDLQAQDRAYRIGQTRDVEVFRLVSAGTIEEIVYARQIYKQQQANIGYNASLERRYFRGVDGTSKKGEIFGLTNLFNFQAGGYVLRDIVNKTNVAEVKAGVKVVDIEVDEASADSIESEEAAMSQLLEELGDIDVKGKKKNKWGEPNKSDPISAILSGAGVQYSHENSEVIGKSKIEAKLSRKAMELQNDLELGSKKVFEASQSQMMDMGEYDIESSENESKEYEAQIGYKYRPPEDVRMRQFCTMAKMEGYDDPTEFALVVELMTQEERKNYLEGFYRKRRNFLHRRFNKGEVINEHPFER